jgi:hypothetical protein
MKSLVLVGLVAGCTSEPALGSANITVSTGFPILSAYSTRGSGVVEFSDRPAGTSCAELQQQRAVDAYHDQLSVQMAATDGTFPIASAQSASAAYLRLYDDCTNLGCFDATAVFDTGTVTVQWGADAATGTIDAHGSTVQASNLVISGSFEATYCP